MSQIDRPTANEIFREHDSHDLLQAVTELSRQQDLTGVMTVIRRWARDLTGADGVTFVLVDGERVHYADENAISPLWKGQRFPASACISGWAIQHRQPVVIPDIYADERIPVDAYKPTFVHSLAIMPIRLHDPIGAIGAYWADHHQTTQRELTLLQALADATSTAMSNVYLIEQLQEAVKVRDDFLRIASHELRTPVSALALQLSNLSRHLRHEPPLANRVHDAENSLQHLILLIERMLDVGAVLTGGLQPLPEIVELRGLVMSVTRRLKEPIERSGCVLHMDAPKPVPGVWDRGLIHTAIFSLLSNAITYGAGKPVHISLRTTPQHVATLAITDEGIGIAAHDHQRIFERFGRAVPVDQYGGFGLGLWLTQTIVQAHGGTITVDSELGRGATFTVSLPLAAATV